MRRLSTSRRSSPPRARGEGGAAGSSSSSSSVPPAPPPACIASARRTKKVSAIKNGEKAAPWQYANMKNLHYHEDYRPAFMGTFTHPAPSTVANAEAKAEAANAEMIAGADGWIAGGGGDGGAAAASSSTGFGGFGGGGFGGNRPSNLCSEPPPTKVTAAMIGRIFGNGFSTATEKTEAEGAGGSSSADAAGGEPEKGKKFYSDGFGNGAVSRRRPFGKDDSLFDYDLDSEAEWEEEGEEGEELEGDDLGKDEEDEEMGSDDEDGWLEKDEEEMTEEERRKRAEGITPTVHVCAWLGGTPEMQAFLDSISVVIIDDNGYPEPQPGDPDDVPQANNPFVVDAKQAAADFDNDFVVETRLPPAAALQAGPSKSPTFGASSSSSGGGKQVTLGGAVAEDDFIVDDLGESPKKQARPVKSVSLTELPRLAKLVHGNKDGLAKIVNSFVESIPSGEAAASKAQVKAQIQSIATYAKPRGGGATCWQVSKERLAELGVEVELDPLTAPSIFAAAAPAPAPAATTAASSSSSASASSAPAAAAAAPSSAAAPKGKSPVKADAPAAKPAAASPVKLAPLFAAKPATGGKSPVNAPAAKPPPPPPEARRRPQAAARGRRSRRRRRSPRSLLWGRASQRPRRRPRRRRMILRRRCSLARRQSKSEAALVFVRLVL